MSTTHGRLTIVAPRDCESCHHRDETPCARCHATERLVSYPQSVQMTVANEARTRQLTFDHANHRPLECSKCHGGTPMATTATCTSCHTQHHDLTRDCIACHASPPPAAHDRTAHLTCTGVGCHSPRFLTGEPRPRQACLACHQSLVDHRPGENCVDCHVLPPFHGDTVRMRRQ